MGNTRAEHAPRTHGSAKAKNIRVHTQIDTRMCSQRAQTHLLPITHYKHAPHRQGSWPLHRPWLLSLRCHLWRLLELIFLLCLMRSVSVRSRAVSFEIEQARLLAIAVAMAADRVALEVLTVVAQQLRFLVTSVCYCHCCCHCCH